MQIQILTTVPENIDAIFRIESHPLVQAQQYPLGDLNSVEKYRTRLFGTDNRGGFSHGTIWIDGRIAGSITRVYRPYCGRVRVHYGWNLDPEFWGRGIMPTALKEDFAGQFRNPQIGEAEIDCFHDNRRCIRVLQKLGCRPTFINPLERVCKMLEYRCGRWIIRHRLTRRRWNDLRSNTESGLG